MGTMVPHEICDECEGEPPLPDTSLQFHSISLVKFTDDQIRQVAERLKVSEGALRDRLAGKGAPIPGVNKAFYRITSCYPFSLQQSGA